MFKSLRVTLGHILLLAVHHLFQTLSFLPYVDAIIVYIEIKALTFRPSWLHGVALSCKHECQEELCEKWSKSSCKPAYFLTSTHLTQMLQDLQTSTLVETYWRLQLSRSSGCFPESGAQNSLSCFSQTYLLSHSREIVTQRRFLLKESTLENIHLFWLLKPLTSITLTSDGLLVSYSSLHFTASGKVFSNAFDALVSLGVHNQDRLE